jgi:hypothetical protein
LGVAGRLDAGIGSMKFKAPLNQRKRGSPYQCLFRSDVFFRPSESDGITCKARETLNGFRVPPPARFGIYYPGCFWGYIHPMFAEAPLIASAP